MRWRGLVQSPFVYLHFPPVLTPAPLARILPVLSCAHDHVLLLRCPAGALAWPDEPLLCAVEVLGAVDGEEWTEARSAKEASDMARHDTRAIQWAAREAMWNEDVRVRNR